MSQKAQLCKKDDQCPVNLVCRKDGVFSRKRCREPLKPKAKLCKKDDQCPVDLVCRSSGIISRKRCREPLKPKPKLCKKDDQCPENLVCRKVGVFSKKRCRTPLSKEESQKQISLFNKIKNKISGAYGKLKNKVNKAVMNRYIKNLRKKHPDKYEELQENINIFKKK